VKRYGIAAETEQFVQGAIVELQVVTGFINLGLATA